ncbi:MAG: hypothetical protein NC299_00225 [Lachnospiraceae bacterium]|nr:hypothetical protein [Ruminococcus sp.]MCM1273772.1 hypothetical protein [Lachnospiraceae bacterium]
MPRKDKEMPEKNPPREEKPKRRRRRAPVILFLILLLLIIIVVLLVFKPFGGSGLGLGGNGSSGDSQGSSSASDSVSEPESSQSGVAVIRIDGTDIFLDGEKCESADALKEKITALGTKKEYELDHSTAIKATYDEVKQVLAELENALDIKVDYNE